MPRNAQGQHYAANAREGRAYLPQVSPVESIAPSGARSTRSSTTTCPSRPRTSSRPSRAAERLRVPRDGSRHGNRERNLPRGNYEEYTVSTTGRGDTAHRVMHRTDTNQFYYSGFHYSDFSLVKNIP